MCLCPIDAILIKIASMGLKVRNLGKTIQELRPALTVLNNKFGFHVCGEGGEYETLTLDSPLFLKRIVLDCIDTIVESDDDFSSVAYIHVNEFHLEEKPIKSQERIHMEELLALPSEQVSSSVMEEVVPLSLEDCRNSINISHSKTGRFLSVQGSLKEEFGGISTQRQISSLLGYLSNEMSNEYGVDIRTNAVFVHLYLRDMDNFKQANQVYVNFFDPTQPPSRECVAFELPEGIEVAIEIISVDDCTLKSILHVQSISEWAPACIGPYSQACSVSGLIHLAGMIGLDPGTMQLVGIEEQMSRSLLSIDQVLEVVHSSSERVFCCTMYYVEQLLKQERLGKYIEQLFGWLENRITTFRTVMVKTLPRNSLVEVQLLCQPFDVAPEQNCEEVTFPSFKATNGEQCIVSGNTHYVLDYTTTTHAISAVVQVHMGWEFDLPTGLEVVCHQITASIAKSCKVSWECATSIRFFYNCDKSIVENLITKLNHQVELPLPVTILPVSQISPHKLLTVDARISIEVYYYQ